jgi:hypothetical protein
VALPQLVSPLPESAHWQRLVLSAHPSVLAVWQILVQQVRPLEVAPLDAVPLADPLVVAQQAEPYSSEQVSALLARASARASALAEAWPLRPQPHAQAELLRHF